LKAFCTYDNQQLSCLHFPPHWEGVNQGGVWLTPHGCCAHLFSKVTVLTWEFYFMCLYDFCTCSWLVECVWMCTPREGGSRAWDQVRI